LVWNGVSAAPARDREALRREWGCGPEDILLGCVARIEPQKNPLFIPKLLAQLPANVRLVWIGDGSLREALRESAAALGVSDRLMLPGWQHNARALMAGFDLFTLPSLYEGFPFAILEAMAAGLPCVVSDVDGVAEAVVDGETGYVCPPNALDVWLDRIRRYLADPDHRRQAGLRARARYAENFSLDVMARKTAEVYYSLLPAHTNPTPLSPPRERGRG
jgi:glycosyltransferase involved in cell wall biosynthesis